MLHATGRARFATKSLLRSRVSNKPLTEDLNGDRSINQQVRRAIDCAHPAATQPFIEAVFLVKSPIEQWIDGKVGDRRVGLKRRLISRAHQHFVGKLPAASGTLEHRNSRIGEACFIITQNELRPLTHAAKSFKLSLFRDRFSVEMKEARIIGDRHAYVTPALLMAVVLFLFSHALAQQKKERKLKEFGSSLTRIKWDAVKKIAVEVKPRSSLKIVSDDIDIVKVETSLVSNDVLVLDAKGNFVPGLSEQDFVIAEDGQPQQISTMTFGDSPNMSRSIVLIIDYGCSQLPFIKASVAAAKIMIDKLTAGDRMAIVTDDIELLTGFTGDKRKLKESLDQLLRRTSITPMDREFVLDQYRQYPPPFGRGFQYSALMAVLKEAFDAEEERPIIIFQTDGSEARLLRNPIIADGVAPGLPPYLRLEAEARFNQAQNFRKRNLREFSLEDIYKAAEQSRATIYSIIPGLRFVGLKGEERPAQMRAFIEREMAGFNVGNYRKKMIDYLNHAGDEALAYDADSLMKQQSALAVLSTISGGWTEFFDQTSQANEIYSRIFSDINRRYVLGYYSTNKAHDGKRRKVNIAVREHPEYIVIGHKAYYGPSSD
jgi:VWFA-related protein